MIVKSLKIVISLCFFANLLLFYSCGTEEEEREDSLQLIISGTEYTVGETIDLFASSYYNQDVTNEAVFYIDNESIDGTTYVTNEEGMHTVYATWNGLTSNTATFTVIDDFVPPQGFVKNVLVEDYTGTWCGYCTRMANIMDLITGNVEQAVPVAVHAGNDPYAYEYATQLQNAYQANGLPVGKINRTNTLNQFECGIDPSPYVEQLEPFINTTSNVGIAINSSYEDDVLSVQAQVNALDGFTNHKLVVLILEDGLIYNQTNYLIGTGGDDCEYTNLPNPIPNFEHNHVLRHALTDIFGDTIPADESVYTFNGTVLLSSYVENPDETSIVAFVVNSEGEVLNVRSAHIGETMDYQTVD